jgi:hypothetical protein
VIDQIKAGLWDRLVVPNRRTERRQTGSNWIYVSDCIVPNAWPQRRIVASQRPEADGIGRNRVEETCEKLMCTRCQIVHDFRPSMEKAYTRRNERTSCHGEGNAGLLLAHR